jgi:hypothetical protein
MHEFTLALLIDYLYNKFLMAFVISLLGAFTRDVMDTYKNLSKINISKVVCSSIFSSVILSAIIDIVNWNFSVHVVVCFFTGLWSHKLLEFVMDWNIVKTFLVNILKNTKGTVAQSISETIKEVDDKDNSKEEQNSNTSIEDKKGEEQKEKQSEDIEKNE